MILAGVLAIFIPPVAGLAVTIFVGWLLVFSGVAHLVFAWQTRSSGSLVWELLLGVVYLLVGFYLLWNPVLGLVSLTFGWHFILRRKLSWSSFSLIAFGRCR